MGDDVKPFFSEAAASDAEIEALVEMEAGYPEIGRLLRHAERALRLETKEQRRGEGLTQEQARMHGAWEFVRAAQRVVRKVSRARRKDRHFTFASLNAPKRGGPDGR